MGSEMCIRDSIATVNDAMYSHNRQVMLDLAKQLDEANNLGCPL